jgi:hypothetical protein
MGAARAVRGEGKRRGERIGRIEIREAHGGETVKDFPFPSSSWSLQKYEMKAIRLLSSSHTRHFILQLKKSEKRGNNECKEKFPQQR